MQTFTPAIPAFEITRACVSEQRDVTKEELAKLTQLSTAHPNAASVYLTVHGDLSKGPYPKLKSFLKTYE